MKALTYQGAKDVRVENVPDPVLLAQDDVLLRVTATAICGSDLHIYRGKIPGMKDGDILGHEFMGIVEEVGPAVTALRPGDRVVVPFVIACGSCFYCDKTLFAACENTNPGRGAILNKKNATAGAGLFGYSHLYGGYPGGQAEYVRVPHGNVGPLKVPQVLSDEQVLFLSDILPTGYQAAVNAQIGAGSSVAIFGAGPVGLMSAPWRRASWVRSRSSWWTITSTGCSLPRPRTAWCPSTSTRTRTRPKPFSRPRVGTAWMPRSTPWVSRPRAARWRRRSPPCGWRVPAARRCARASPRRPAAESSACPGVYAGFIHGFLFGDAFEKGLPFRMGQTHAQKYMPQLLEHIANGRMRPEVIISHRMKLADAVRGYEIFEKKEEECRKVVLTP